MNITPLGAQILIRPIIRGESDVLVIPDSAKKTTQQGSDGSRVHFVEAEVVAVGPGRKRVDSDLVPDLVQILRHANDPSYFGDASALAVLRRRIAAAILRAESDGERIPLDVQPGDRILYHPSVRNFDRAVYVDGVEHFLIGEHSVLAVLGPGAVVEEKVAAA